MANPTTNFGWVMPTSTSLVTNLPADFNTFGQGVDTSLQYLLGGTTGQVLSKTSGTNMAFTWVTPTDQTPLTTKGDLFTFSTVDARLAVGTNGQTLVADSTTATGLKWATAAKFAQIVQATYSTQTAITSTSYVTTGLNASITPTATSSKVLVMASIPVQGPTAQQLSITIFRGTVAGTNLASDMLANQYDAYGRTMSVLFLDSPSTTSAQTYTIGVKVSGSTGYTTPSPSTGVITLTEVLA